MNWLRNWLNERKEKHFNARYEAGFDYATKALITKAFSAEELQSKSDGAFNQSETEKAFDKGVHDAIWMHG